MTNQENNMTNPYASFIQSHPNAFVVGSFGVLLLAIVGAGTLAGMTYRAVARSRIRWMNRRVVWDLLGTLCASMTLLCIKGYTLTDRPGLISIAWCVAFLLFVDMTRGCWRRSTSAPCPE